MAMAGVYSSGIIFPLSILPEKCKIVEGKDVSDILEIRKYDPEALKEEREFQQVKIKHGALWHWLCRFKWFRRFFLKKEKSCCTLSFNSQKNQMKKI